MGALSATRAANTITLVARWPTAMGASALVTVAREETLAQKASAGTLPVGGATVPALPAQLESVGAARFHTRSSGRGGGALRAAGASSWRI